MSGGGPSGAEQLGERLVREVEEGGLSELLASLRNLNHGDSEKSSHFGIPELDALLPSPSPAPTAQQQPQPQAQLLQDQHSDGLWEPNLNPSLHANQPSVHIATRNTDATTKSAHPYPIVELISLPTTHASSGSGKTSLIHLIIALAILPPSFFSNPPIQISGKQAAVVVLDPFSHFSVKRLAEVCLSYILSNIPDGRNIALKDEIKDTVKTALQHVHILRPTSWPSLLSTLSTLPEYLFDRSRHHSMERRIHSLVLEDMEAFSWDIRASSTTPLVASSVTSTSPITLASQDLVTVLLSLSTRFSSSILLSSHSAATSPSTFRTPLPLPTSWPPHVQVTRLAVRRVEVLPFAPGISVEEAERQRGQRWDIVKRGRFECWKVGVNGKGKKEGEGFVFSVGQGVGVEKG